MYEMKEIKGEASVTIRKQKQIFLFDIEGEIYFEAFKVSDPATQCKGKVKFHEINQDDDELCLEITQEKPTDFVSEVKRVINNQGNVALLKCIMTLK
jgi:activator of HSP90 ATPase